MRRKFLAILLFALPFAAAQSATSVEFESGRLQTATFALPVAIPGTTDPPSNATFVDGVGIDLAVDALPTAGKLRTLVGFVGGSEGGPYVDASGNWSASVRFDIDTALRNSRNGTGSSALHAAFRHSIFSFILANGDPSSPTLNSPPNALWSVQNPAFTAHGGDGAYYEADGLVSTSPSLAVSLVLSDNSAFSIPAIAFGIDGQLVNVVSSFQTASSPRTGLERRFSDTPSLPGVDAREGEMMRTEDAKPGSKPRGVVNSTTDSWQLEVFYSPLTRRVEVLVVVSKPPFKSLSPFRVLSYRAMFAVPDNWQGLSSTASIGLGYSSSGRFLEDGNNRVDRSYTLVKRLVVRDFRFKAEPASASASAGGGAGSSSGKIPRCRTNTLIPLVMPSTGQTDYFAYCTRQRFHLSDARLSAALVGGEVASLPDQRDFDAVKRSIVAPCLFDPSSDRGSMAVGDPSPWWLSEGSGSAFYLPNFNIIADDLHPLRAGPLLNINVSVGPGANGGARSQWLRRQGQQLDMPREFRNQPDLDTLDWNDLFASGAPYGAAFLSMQPSADAERFAVATSPVEAASMPGPHGGMMSLLPSRSIGGTTASFFQGLGTFYLLHVSGSNNASVALAQKAEKLGNLCRVQTEMVDIGDVAFQSLVYVSSQGTVFRSSSSSSSSGSTDSGSGSVPESPVVTAADTFWLGSWTMLNETGLVKPPALLSRFGVLTPGKVPGERRAFVHRRPTVIHDSFSVNLTIAFGRTGITNQPGDRCADYEGCVFGGWGISFLPVDDERDLEYLLKDVDENGNDRSNKIASDWREPFYSNPRAASLFFPIVDVPGVMVTALGMANGSSLLSMDAQLYDWPQLDSTKPNSQTLEVAVTYVDDLGGTGGNVVSSAFVVQVQGRFAFNMYLPKRLADYLRSDSAYIAIFGRSSFLGFGVDESTMPGLKTIAFESAITHVGILTFPGPAVPSASVFYEYQQFWPQVARDAFHFSSDRDSACKAYIPTTPLARTPFESVGIVVADKDCTSDNPLVAPVVRTAVTLKSPKVDVRDDFRARFTFDLATEQRPSRFAISADLPTLAITHAVVSVILGPKPWGSVLARPAPGVLSLGTEHEFFFGPGLNIDGGYFETADNKGSLAVGLSFVTPSFSSTVVDALTGQPPLRGDGTNVGGQLPPRLATIALGINGLWNASYSFPASPVADPTRGDGDVDSWNRLFYGRAWLTQNSTEPEPLNADGTRMASGAIPWIFTGRYFYTLEVVYRRKEHALSVLVVTTRKDDRTQTSPFYAERTRVARAKFPLPKGIDFRTFFTDPEARPADDPLLVASPRLSLGFTTANTFLDATAFDSGIDFSSYPIVTEMVLRSFSFETTVDDFETTASSARRGRQQLSKPCRSNTLLRSPLTGASYAYCSARLLGGSEATQAAAAAGKSLGVSSTEVMSGVGKSGQALTEDDTTAELDWLRSEVIGPCLVGEDARGAVSRYDSNGTATFGALIGARAVANDGASGAITTGGTPFSIRSNNRVLSTLLPASQYGLVNDAKVRDAAQPPWSQGGVARSQKPWLGPLPTGVNFVVGPTKEASDFLNGATYVPGVPLSLSDLPPYATSLSVDLSDYGTDAAVAGGYFRDVGLPFLIRVPADVPDSWLGSPSALPTLCHPPPLNASIAFGVPPTRNNMTFSLFQMMGSSLLGARTVQQRSIPSLLASNSDDPALYQRAARGDSPQLNGPGISNLFFASATMSRFSVNASSQFTARFGFVFSNVPFCAPPASASACAAYEENGGYFASLSFVAEEQLAPLHMLPGPRAPDERDWRQPLASYKHGLTLFRPLNSSFDPARAALGVGTANELSLSVGGVVLAPSERLAASPSAFLEGSPFLSSPRILNSDTTFAAYIKNEELTIAHLPPFTASNDNNNHLIVVTTRTVIAYSGSASDPEAAALLSSCSLIVRRVVFDISESLWKAAFGPSSGMAYVAMGAVNKRQPPSRGYALTVPSWAYEISLLPEDFSSDISPLLADAECADVVLPSPSPSSSPSSSPSASTSVSPSTFPSTQASVSPSASLSPSASPSVSPASLASPNPATMAAGANATSKGFYSELAGLRNDFAAADGGVQNAGPLFVTGQGQGTASSSLCSLPFSGNSPFFSSSRSTFCRGIEFLPSARDKEVSSRSAVVRQKALPAALAVSGREGLESALETALDVNDGFELALSFDVALETFDTANGSPVASDDAASSTSIQRDDIWKGVLGGLTVVLRPAEQLAADRVKSPSLASSLMLGDVTSIDPLIAALANATDPNLLKAGPLQDDAFKNFFFGSGGDWGGSFFDDAQRESGSPRGLSIGVPLDTREVDPAVDSFSSSLPARHNGGGRGSLFVTRIPRVLLREDPARFVSSALYYQPGNYPVGVGYGPYPNLWPPSNFCVPPAAEGTLDLTIRYSSSDSTLDVSVLFHRKNFASNATSIKATEGAQLPFNFRLDDLDLRALLSFPADAPDKPLTAYLGVGFSAAGGRAVRTRASLKQGDPFSLYSNGTTPNGPSKFYQLLKSVVLRRVAFSTAGAVKAPTCLRNGLLAPPPSLYRAGATHQRRSLYAVCTRVKQTYNEAVKLAAAMGGRVADFPSISAAGNISQWLQETLIRPCLYTGKPSDGMSNNVFRYFDSFLPSQQVLVDIPAQEAAGSFAFSGRRSGYFGPFVGADYGSSSPQSLISTRLASSLTSDFSSLLAFYNASTSDSTTRIPSARFSASGAIVADPDDLTFTRPDLPFSFPLPRTSVVKTVFTPKRAVFAVAPSMATYDSSRPRSAALASRYASSATLMTDPLSLDIGLVGDDLPLPYGGGANDYSPDDTANSFLVEFQDDGGDSMDTTTIVGNSLLAAALASNGNDATGLCHPASALSSVSHTLSSVRSYLFQPFGATNQEFLTFAALSRKFAPPSEYQQLLAANASVGDVTTRIRKTTGALMYRRPFGVAATTAWAIVMGVHFPATVRCNASNSITPEEFRSAILPPNLNYPPRFCPLGGFAITFFKLTANSVEEEMDRMLQLTQEAAFDNNGLARNDTDYSDWREPLRSATNAITFFIPLVLLEGQGGELEIDDHGLATNQALDDAARRQNISVSVKGFDAPFIENGFTPLKISGLVPSRPRASMLFPQILMSYQPLGEWREDLNQFPTVYSRAPQFSIQTPDSDYKPSILRIPDSLDKLLNTDKVYVAVVAMSGASSKRRKVNAAADGNGPPGIDPPYWFASRVSTFQNLVTSPPLPSASPSPPAPIPTTTRAPGSMNGGGANTTIAETIKSVAKRVFGSAYDGATIATGRFSGAAAPTFRGPSSMAVDPISGDVFVASSGGNIIQALRAMPSAASFLPSSANGGNATTTTAAVETLAGNGLSSFSNSLDALVLPASASAAGSATKLALPAPKSVAYHAPSCTLFALPSSARTILALPQNATAGDGGKSEDRVCVPLPTTGARPASSVYTFARQAPMTTTGVNGSFVALSSDPCSSTLELFALFTISRPATSPASGVALFSSDGRRTLLWLGDPTLPSERPEGVSDIEFFYFPSSYSIVLPGDLVVPRVAASVPLAPVGSVNALVRSYRAIAVKSTTVGSPYCGAPAPAYFGKDFTIKDTRYTSVAVAFFDQYSIRLPSGAVDSIVNGGILVFTVAFDDKNPFAPARVISVSAAFPLVTRTGMGLGRLAFPSSLAFVPPPNGTVSNPIAARGYSLVVADAFVNMVFVVVPDTISPGPTGSNLAVSTAPSAVNNTVAGHPAFLSFLATGYQAILYPLPAVDATAVTAKSSSSRLLQSRATGFAEVSNPSALVFVESAGGGNATSNSSSSSVLLVAEGTSGLLHSLQGLDSNAIMSPVVNAAATPSPSAPTVAAIVADPQFDNKAGGIAAGVLAVIVLVPLLIVLAVLAYFYWRALKRRQQKQRASLLRDAAVERMQQFKDADAEGSSSAVVDALAAALLLPPRRGADDDNTAASSALTPSILEQQEAARKALANSVADEILLLPALHLGAATATAAAKADDSSAAALAAEVQSSLDPEALRETVLASLDASARALKAGPAALSNNSNDDGDDDGEQGAAASSSLHRALIKDGVDAVVRKATADAKGAGGNSSADALVSFLLPSSSSDGDDDAATKRAKLERLALASSNFLSSYYRQTAACDLALPLTDANASLLLMPLQAVITSSSSEAKNGADGSSSSSSSVLDLARSRVMDRVAAAELLAASTPHDNDDDEEGEGAPLQIIAEEGEGDNEGDSVALLSSSSSSSSSSSASAAAIKAALRSGGSSSTGSIKTKSFGLSQASRKAAVASASPLLSSGAAAFTFDGAAGAQKRAEALAGGALRKAGKLEAEEQGDDGTEGTAEPPLLVLEEGEEVDGEDASAVDPSAAAAAAASGSVKRTVTSSAVRQVSIGKDEAKRKGTTSAPRSRSATLGEIQQLSDEQLAKKAVEALVVLALDGAAKKTIASFLLEADDDDDGDGEGEGKRAQKLPSGKNKLGPRKASSRMKNKASSTRAFVNPLTSASTASTASSTPGQKQRKSGASGEVAAVVAALLAAANVQGSADGAAEEGPGKRASSVHANPLHGGASSSQKAAAPQYQRKIRPSAIALLAAAGYFQADDKAIANDSGHGRKLVAPSRSSTAARGRLSAADQNEALRRLLERQMQPMKQATHEANKQARREAWEEAKDATISAVKTALAAVVAPCVRGKAAESSGKLQLDKDGGSQRFYVSRNSLQKAIGVRGQVTDASALSKKDGGGGGGRIYVTAKTSNTESAREGRRGSALVTLLQQQQQQPQQQPGQAPLPPHPAPGGHDPRPSFKQVEHQFISPLHASGAASVSGSNNKGRRSFMGVPALSATAPMVPSASSSATVAQLKASAGFYTGTGANANANANNSGGNAAAAAAAAALVPFELAESKVAAPALAAAVAHTSSQRRRSSFGLLQRTAVAPIAHHRGGLSIDATTDGVEADGSSFAAVSPLLLQQQQGMATGQSAAHTATNASSSARPTSGRSTERQRLLLQFASPAALHVASASAKQQEDSRRLEEDVNDDEGDEHDGNDQWEDEEDDDDDGAQQSSPTEDKWQEEAEAEDDDGAEGVRSGEAEEAPPAQPLPPDRPPSQPPVEEEEKKEDTSAPLVPTPTPTPTPAPVLAPAPVPAPVASPPSFSFPSSLPRPPVPPPLPAPPAISPSGLGFGVVRFGLGLGALGLPPPLPPPLSPTKRPASASAAAVRPGSALSSLSSQTNNQ